MLLLARRTIPGGSLLLQAAVLLLLLLGGGGEGGGSGWTGGRDRMLGAGEPREKLAAGEVDAEDQASGGGGALLGGLLQRPLRRVREWDCLRCGGTDTALSGGCGVEKGAAAEPGAGRRAGGVGLG